MSYPRKSALPNYRSSYAKLKKKNKLPKHGLTIRKTI